MAKSHRNILYLSHGGGPLPLLGDAGHQEMIATLQSIASELPRPDAILVISAHWEQATATITSGSQPDLIYDYYGFPDESYDIQYPCPGEPELAAQVATVMGKQGVSAYLDDKRGFDHGLFVPLKIMYPQADIPCIQLSLLSSLDPAEHLQLGQCLAELEYDNLLIIGSGFSFHNLRAFFGRGGKDIDLANHEFEKWLIETCSSTEIDEQERYRRFVHWTEAPYARECHPREEHLLPLHVCYGVAHSPCYKLYPLKIMGKQASMYLW